MLLFLAACLLPAFVVSFAATAVVCRIAPRWGLFDHPADRKLHAVPIPLGGGIGIWMGIAVPLTLAMAAAWTFSAASQTPRWLPAELAVHFDGIRYRAAMLWSILAGATLLAGLGLIDDVRELPWPGRLLVQFLVACGLVAAGVRATLFLPVPWIGGVVTVVWILVLINAFNFLDNMDGLCAGIGMIAAALMAVIMLTSTDQTRWLVGGLSLVIAGSLAGFLCHNRPPARIFMGDSGSYQIGLLLAALTVVGTFYEHEGGNNQERRYLILAPLCILAVPLYDFCSVMLIRLRERRSPFHPDRRHFSHRLVELGLRPGHAVLTLYLATLTTGIGGVLLYHVRGWTGAWLVVGLIACILAVVAILETAARRRNRESEG